MNTMKRHKDIDLDRDRDTPALRDYDIYTISGPKASPAFSGECPDRQIAVYSPHDAAMDWLNSILDHNKTEPDPEEWLSIPWGVMVLDLYNGICTSFEVEVYEEDINIYELAP